MYQQRRVHPSYIDLSLILKSFAISPGDLLYQLDFAKAIRNGPLKSSVRMLKDQSQELLKELNEQHEEDELDRKDKDYEELATLIPSSNKRKYYIQNFIPDFPPDHTYRYSAVYTKKVEDPKRLRQILVEEGNAALKSLLSLQVNKDKENELDVADNDEKIENINSSNNAAHALLSPPMSPKSDTGPIELLLDKKELEEKPNADNVGTEDKDKESKVISNAEAEAKQKEEAEKEKHDFGKININLPTKPLDIVKYSKQRLSMLKRKQDYNLEKINKLRRDDSLVNHLTIAKHLSSYDSTQIDRSIINPDTRSTGTIEDRTINFSINEAIGHTVVNTLNDQYNLLLVNLRRQKKDKHQRYLRKLKLKQEKEEEERKKRQEQEELNKQRDKELNEIDFDNLEFGFDDEHFDIDPTEPSETTANKGNNAVASAESEKKPDDKDAANLLENAPAIADGSKESEKIGNDNKPKEVDNTALAEEQNTENVKKEQNDSNDQPTSTPSYPKDKEKSNSVKPEDETMEFDFSISEGEGQSDEELFKDLLDDEDDEKPSDQETKLKSQPTEPTEPAEPTKAINPVESTTVKAEDKSILDIPQSAQTADSANGVNESNEKSDNINKTDKNEDATDTISPSNDASKARGEELGEEIRISDEQDLESDDDDLNALLEDV